MPDTLFHQFVDNEGWSEATQVDLLLRYIGAQDDLAAFADFLAQCRDTEPGGVSDPADRFMWEVAERLCNPGLTLNAAFQRSEEHTSELQSLMRISYAVFCLKKKNDK